MQISFKKYRKLIFMGLVFGLFVVLSLLFFADFKAVSKVLHNINIAYLPIIFMLAPLNYALRYAKWNYYLNCLDIHIDKKVSRNIFISGLAMTITPGKIGELFKSYLLKEESGIPIAKSSPIIVAERATDGIAMILLASVGTLTYSYGFLVLILTLLVMTVGLSFLYFDKPYLIIKNMFSRFDFTHKYFSWLDRFKESSKILFAPKSLFFAIGIGIISWGFEGLVVFFSLRALGGEISILGSIFVVAFSSVVGAVSTLPGGLGVAEGSIVAILMLLGVSKEMSAATTLVTRFSTLWLGVIIGMIGLWNARKYMEIRG